MSKTLGFLGGIACAALIGGVIFFTATPTGRGIINSWQYSLKKTDEKTYENQKMVEDTLRSYIVSYNADKLAYYQYKDSESPLERSWAAGYKNRANSTATAYNEFFLKNSYVFQGNVPSDIYYTLEIINE